MQVQVNGVRLHFDVLGAKLMPRGPRMHERPTVLMLHGGPGADHSHYRPEWDALADVAQLIYLDHRGNGRSEAGPQPLWTLAQWADDARAFCDALGIERPIVLGVSFGGIVAQAYATRHPGHAAKLILVSTAARGGAFTERRVALFEQLGGAEAGALARRPTLLIGGALDPMLPVENQREMAALLPPHLLRYEEFPHAGHGVLPDAREAALALLREFILA